MAARVIAKAKVAGLISGIEVSINAGTNKGLAVGDIATVYRSVPIVDPDSGVNLGSVEVSRLRLNLFLVSEKFSVGKVLDRLSTADNFAAPRPLKRATLDEDEESPSMVLIAPGDPVTVRREEAEPEEG